MPISENSFNQGKSFTPSNPLKDLLAKEWRSQADVVHFSKDILGLDLWPKQKEILRDFYDPNNGYKELVLCCGMRSGKTFLASVIAVYEIYKVLQITNPQKFFGLPPGQEIFVINVATSERQARDTVFAHIQARIENADWFQSQNFKPLYNEYRFKTGKGRSGDIVVRSEHSNSASLVGKSALAVIFDEIARFNDSKGKASGQLVYDSLSRATQTFGPYGKRVSISSPVYVDDMIMKLLRLCKKIPAMRGHHLATWELNPNITREDLEQEFIKNPEGAMRDYGAVPSASIETWMKEAWRLEGCRLRIGNPITSSNGALFLQDWWIPSPQYTYFMAGDPSYKGDAFGIALGHANEEGKAIFDFLGRFESAKIEDRLEIDVDNVKSFILTTILRIQSVGALIPKVSFDTWNYPETVKAIRLQGVDVEQHTVKKADYDMVKERVYSNPPLVGWDENEMTEVFEKEVSSVEAYASGRIDHPTEGSKDVSDAAANVVRMIVEAAITLADEPVWYVEQEASYNGY